MTVNAMSFAVAAVMLTAGTADAQDRCRKITAVRSQSTIIVDLGPGALAAVTLCAGDAGRTVEIYVDGRLHMQRRSDTCGLVSGRQIAVKVPDADGTSYGIGVSYCVEAISLRP